MKPKVSFILSLVVVLIIVFNSVGYAQGVGYPNKRIQIIVTTRAGGGVDTFFRLLSEELQKYWKVSVNVVNQVGAGGATGSDAVANADKDGYTLLGTLVGILSTMTAAKPEGPINLLRDFDGVFINAGYTSGIYVVRSDSKFKSLKDLIDYAKEKPGELIYGSAQRGGEIYLEWELLKKVANVNITTLVFSGGAEAMIQLLGGHIHIAGSSEVAAQSHIKAGKIRPLVVDMKSSIFPEVSTFAESGYPEVDLFGSIGLLGPKGLPPDIIKTWESAFEVILRDPKFIDSVKKLGININFLMGTEKIRDFLKGEVKKYSRFTPYQLGWE